MYMLNVWRCSNDIYIRQGSPDKKCVCVCVIYYKQLVVHSYEG